ncbi:unnamed protein product [Caretta caretta]
MLEDVIHPDQSYTILGRTIFDNLYLVWDLLEPGMKPCKKSAIPGVTIKQFVEVIPKGCSTPDFERKPITLTLQEGKNAIFRAVVKGEPPPKVIWRRSKEEMNNPDKYQMSFSGITNEFILKINKLSTEDTDLYHCSAVNEYGEAACIAGLKVIQDLKKELQDFRKILRKRTPLPAQKEVDMEQVWQLLLNADRKDYEKICLKYGIVDFRGMLRKLQQMRKDREDKQQQYIYSVTNLKHIKVNKEGNATFHLEMDLKNPESRIYLYKDGQLINYGFNDDKVKHCLRQAGKKYNFTINHLQLEDAGVYQIKVEDVDVFSTELEADFIPVGFRRLLSEVHCHEQGNAIFECSLYSPCYDAMWLYRKHPIEKSDKYKISISPDGLTHQLVIKNTQLTDKGTYTLDIRICSSSAWLEVESARGKSRQTEGDGTDKTGWQTDKSMLLDEEGAKELLQGEGLGNQNHLKSTRMGKDGQYGSNQDGSRDLYGSSMDVDWQHGSLGQDRLTGRVGKDGRMGKGQFSGAGTDGVSVANGNKFGLASSECGRLGKIHGQDLKLGGAGIGSAIVEGDLHSFYGEESMLGGAGSGGGLGGAGGLGSLDGRDSMLGGAGARLGGSGELGSLHGMEGGANIGGAGLGGAGSVGSLYGKDGMLLGASVGAGDHLDGAGAMGALGDRDAILGASDVGGAGSGDAGGTSSLFGGAGSLYGKDVMLGGASVGAGLDGAGGMGAFDGGGAGSGGAGGMGSLCGKDGMKGGTSAGLRGAGGIQSFYDEDDMLAGAGAHDAGLGDACGRKSLCGKDGMLGAVGAVAGGDEAEIGGTSARLGGAGGMRSPGGKDRGLGGDGAGTGVGGDDLGSPGAIGSLYGNDGMLGGAGAAGAGAGSGFGGAGGGVSLYGKNGMIGGAGSGADGFGAGVSSPGRMETLSGKDAISGGADAGLGRAGGLTGALCGKNGMHSAGLGDSRGEGYLCGKDAMLGGAGTGLDSAGRIDSLYGKDPILGGHGVGGAAAGLAGAGTMGSLSGKDAMLSGVGAGSAGAGTMGSLSGKDAMLSGVSAGSAGAGTMGSLSGKDAMLSGVGAGSAGAGDIGSLYGKDAMLSGVGAGSAGAGTMGSLSGKDAMLSGVGAGSAGAGDIGSLYGKDAMLSGVGAGSAGAGTMGSLSGKDAMLSGVGAGSAGAGDIGSLYGKDGKDESHCHFNKGLSDVSAQKGKPTVLSCSLNNDQVEGIWFKDEFEQLTGLDELSSEKYGLVHKLIDTVEESHAGKYKFEAEGVKTEASIFVEDPPNVDKALLEKLMKEPVIVKAGQNAIVKIPFEGRKPVRATWLRDGDELLNDARIHIDKADSFTRLSISSTNRKDCGDYKVKLKNESGTLEASLKLEVIDKPQKPIGPIEVVDSSTTGITIRWKPPKDDGGRPVQNYIIERQQVGRKTWVTLGETSRDNSTFTTNKVGQDKSYRFRVRAVNAEGKSKALESDEVMAATKAFPGPPAPPQIVSANKESITLSWAAPPKTGNSRILGYIVEKRKKGSNIWIPISDLPITDRKWMVTDLKEGLQYEFRVAAINAAGTGEASAPSDPVFARDPMKPPGRVRDLKVTNTDYTSITLAWMKPDSMEGGPAKGYKVEKKSSDSLKWTHCNTVPIGLTTCTVKGLQAREMYFLRVRAVNEGGLGEAIALDTCIQAMPPIVSPKFLRDDTMKNFMIIKAGSCIRVHTPFEASPTPEVIWLKDGLPLPSRAIVSTRDGLSQLLIPSAEFSDSGLYTIILQNEWGKKESFSFQVQVAAIPQSPGPILLQEKVLNTVTVIWEPSPTEKWESNLYYVVMKRDSNKGSWQVVADLIYNNKFTITKLIPGRGYYFRVVAKNYMGTSDPSETVQPWIMQKEKDEFKVRLPKYRRVNQNMPPRFLLQLKPHVVTTAFDCHMSCAVSGYPKPKITWYKDGRDLSEDHTFFSTNDFGVCCLVIPGVTKRDEGEYKVEATNELGHVVSKAMLIIKA